MTHPACVRVIQEVRPVGIRLHEIVLKQFCETQPKNVGANLQWKDDSLIDDAIKFNIGSLQLQSLIFNVYKETLLRKLPWFLVAIKGKLT